MSDLVVAYYERKTSRILAKYGPGPRVHFHTGLVDRPAPTTGGAAELRRAMVAAQDSLIEDSVRAWDLRRGRILDVGCGLGGGALLLAQRLDSPVTALTNVAAHAPLVREFARVAGVSDLVKVQVDDASGLRGPARFDAAVAIEASCYLDPDAWFACLDRVVLPGGRVLVVDCFLGRRDVAAGFDRYWKTRIGSLEAADRAAARHGFHLEKSERLNARCVGFWSLSLAWIRATLASEKDPPERERLLNSLVAHEALRRHFADGAIEYLRVSFRREATDP